MEQIRSIHEENGGVLGSPKIWEELLRRGQRRGENPVARLMRNAALQGTPSVRR